MMKSNFIDDQMLQISLLKADKMDELAKLIIIIFYSGGPLPFFDYPGCLA